jgi:hypothetical protein
VEIVSVANSDEIACTIEELWPLLSFKVNVLFLTNLRNKRGILFFFATKNKRGIHTSRVFSFLDSNPNIHWTMIELLNNASTPNSLKSIRVREKLVGF